MLIYCNEVLYYCINFKIFNIITDILKILIILHIIPRH